MWIFLLLVNNGSGKLPAYRGLVDAVQSIVRTGGLKGCTRLLMYIHSKLNPQFSDFFGPFVPHGAMQIIYLHYLSV